MCKYVFRIKLIITNINKNKIKNTNKNGSNDGWQGMRDKVAHFADGVPIKRGTYQPTHA